MCIFSIITIFGFPGPLAIALATLIYSFENGFNPISGKVTVLFIVLGLFGLVIDNVFALIGARKFGASKMGIIGAIVGLLAIFIIGPFGIFIGPPIGAFSFAILFDKKPMALAAKAAFGVIVGALTGIIAKVTLAVILTIWFGYLVL